MTAVLQWGMHSNQQTALATLTLNTLHCVNGLNVTSSILKGWIQQLILRIILQKHSPEPFFTGMQITYLDIFLQNIPLCMIRSSTILYRITIGTTIMSSTSQHRLPHLPPPQQTGLIRQLKRILMAILGSTQYCGMRNTIQRTDFELWGGVSPR